MFRLVSMPMGRAAVVTCLRARVWICPTKPSRRPWNLPLILVVLPSLLTLEILTLGVRTVLVV